MHAILTEIKKSLFLGAPEQVTQRGCEVSLTGGIHKPSGHNPVL